MLNKTFLALALNLLLLTPLTVSANTGDSLLQQGETALANGQLNNAVSLLQQAQQQGLNPEIKTLTGIALAEALIRSGQLESAETELNKLHQTANASASKGLLAEIALRYGHLYAAQGDDSKAKTWYQQALDHAKATNDDALAAAALINLAKQTKQVSELNQAQTLVAKLPACAVKNTLLLALGYQASQQQQLKIAQQSLQAVLDNTPSQRNKAQAFGLLGHLYEQQQRYPEAMQLTEQALLSDNTPDQHIQWTWQLARLLEQTGDKAAALISYRSAVQQLQNIRLDIPVVYQDGESSFKQTFAPIYLSFIDLLLQQAEQSPNEAAQPLLNEVVQTWEQLKSVELQDYFKDACAVKQKSQNAKLDPHTAVIYPILLSDHLALILRTADNIQVYRVNHTSAEIEERITRLSEQLASVDTLTEHLTLYQWLIAPLKADLEQQHIDTIVYLPDGALRKIPFSILNDGKQFLIDQYALVTVPGLSMIAAPSDRQSREDILLAGMSKPGPVVDELLGSGINLFGASTAENRSLKRRAVRIRNAPMEILNSTERNLRAKQLKEELALPGVTEELKTLAHLTRQPVLENTDFLLSHFKQTVNQGHSAVHIASHGFFSGDPKKSFIMAYDHLLTMEQLTELFQTEAFHDRPVELVTLSACQTAEGDDRSPLGLSGVVVQTGVKSAIGTLWPVADEAAKLFFSDFYQHYQQPNTTKAKAMQYAQQQLIKNKQLNHPAYWGPFVLVGEWH
jgi:CHAT domain-containing protein